MLLCMCIIRDIELGVYGILGGGFWYVRKSRRSHAPAIPGAAQEREEAARDEPTRRHLRGGARASGHRRIYLREDSHRARGRSSFARGTQRHSCPSPRGSYADRREPFRDSRARARACQWHLPCPGRCRDEGVVRCTPRGGTGDHGALRAAGEPMSLIAELIKYGKDIVLLGERVDGLMAERKETTGRLEDQERR